MIKITSYLKDVTAQNIQLNNSRNHLIILDKYNLKISKNLKVGQLIVIKGYLVDILKDKYMWKTSYSINDIGETSGEII